MVWIVSWNLLCLTNCQTNMLAYIFNLNPLLQLPNEQKLVICLLEVFQMLIQISLGDYICQNKKTLLKKSCFWKCIKSTALKKTGLFKTDDLLFEYDTYRKKNTEFDHIRGLIIQYLKLSNFRLCWPCAQLAFAVQLCELL